ncbi:MAG: hypothetical protein Q8P46_11220, partial [Hyphomicrobiales bacterium]|nr:hypothetical protein [Hyphomicrobiales bacterium]
TFGFGSNRHRDIMPNFRPSSNSSTPVLARLSATYAIKNCPYSYAMILFYQVGPCLKMGVIHSHFW